MMHHVEALVTFLTAEQGGRRGPITATGASYYPHIRHGETYAGGRATFPDVECVYPGDTTRVLIVLIAPDLYVGKLRPGMEIELQEGPHTVAVGQITRVWTPLY